MKFLRALDERQQQTRWLAIPVAVIKKFSDDGAGGLAALIAYYGFFSLFPLLLVLFTVLAYVLHGDLSAQNSIKNSVLSQFPVIGPQLKTSIGTIHGHVVSLIVGVVGSLLGGLGVTQASQNAFARVWAVPMKERPNFIQSRLRGLALLTALGLLFIVSTLAAGLVTGGLGGAWAKVAGIAISLVVNFALFLTAFRFMTPVIGTSVLWVGITVATVLWTILEAVGGYYVGHVFKHTGSTYGVFGFVIALIVWLHLGAQVVVYSAEINVVLTRKLYPRSLFGPPSTAADEDTLTELAKVEERSDEEQIDVEFRTDGPERAKPNPPADPEPRAPGDRAPNPPGDREPRAPGDPEPKAPGDRAPRA